MELLEQEIFVIIFPCFCVNIRDHFRLLFNQTVVSTADLHFQMRSSV